MPGTNLTREEAATRAALVTVDRHDVDARRHDRPRDLLDPQHDPLHVQPPGSRDLPRLRRRHRRAASRVNGADLDPAEHHADSRIRLPGLAARERAWSSPPPAATRTPARGCTASSTRSTTRSTSTASSRCRTAGGCTRCSSSPTSRRAFTFTVTAPAHWQVVSNSPTPEPAAGRRGHGHLALRARPPPISSYITALVAGPYDVVRDTVHEPPRRRCRSASSAAGR